MFLALDIRAPFGTISSTGKTVAKVATAPLWIAGGAVGGLVVGAFGLITSPYWIFGSEFSENKLLAAPLFISAPISFPLAVPYFFGQYLFNDEWAEKCRKLKSKLKSIEKVKQN